MDVLALAQHGLTHAVAPLGTALTAEQVKRLNRHAQELVLIFDGDAAGQQAAWRSLEIVTAAQMPTRTVVLPEGEDPDSYVRAQGAAVLAEELRSAPGLMDYFIDQMVAQAPSDNLGKVAVVRRLLPQLGAIPGEVEKTLYFQKLATKLGLSEHALRQELASAAQRGRNFKAGGADDIDARRHEGLRLTPFERDLVQALLSKEAEALALWDEIETSDWVHPAMKQLWPELQARQAKGRSVACLLGEIPDEALQQELSAVALSEAADDTAALLVSCRKRLSDRHRGAKRQDLTRQLREAEAASDSQWIEALLMEQNSLL